MARAMHGPIGSGGAMIWWRRWPAHGGRGPKPLEGRQRLMLVVVCCGCVVVLCSRSIILFTHFVTTPGDISPPFLSMIPCSNAPPQHKSHIYMCWGCVISDKSWEVKFDLAFVFRGKNTSFFGTSVQFTCMIDNLVLKVQVRLNTRKK